MKVATPCARTAPIVTPAPAKESLAAFHSHSSRPDAAQQSQASTKQAAKLEESTRGSSTPSGDLAAPNATVATMERSPHSAKKMSDATCTHGLSLSLTGRLRAFRLSTALMRAAEVLQVQKAGTHLKKRLPPGGGCVRA